MTLTVPARRLLVVLGALALAVVAAVALWPRERTLELDGAGRYVASSRVPWWFNAPRVTRLPQLVGVAKTGVTVRAVPGRWSGGAKDDFSWTGLRACPTRAGGGACVLMSDWRSVGRASPAGRTAVVNPGYSGWYIGAIETRVGADVAITADAWAIPLTTRSVHPAPPPGALVAVSPLVGPVS